jgi:hypothetical protein
MKGGLMAIHKSTGLQEIFIIKTDAIDFFATLVAEEGGNCIVNGRVKFGDGTFSFFRSPAGEHDGLRQTFASMCEGIADFYHADVFHHKFNNVIAYG